MLVPWLSKVILGGSLLTASVGLGIGSTLLVTKESSSKNPVTTKEYNGVEEKEQKLGSEEPSIKDEQSDSPDSETQKTLEREQSINTGSETEKDIASSEEGKDVMQSTVSSSEKRCTIYKILSSKDGRVEEVKEKDLKEERRFNEIKKACDKAKEGDIFISGSNGRNWWYDRNAQKCTEQSPDKSLC